jgi:hypothetical protein
MGKEIKALLAFPSLAFEPLSSSLFLSFSFSPFVSFLSSEFSAGFFPLKNSGLTPYVRIDVASIK